MDKGNKTREGEGQQGRDKGQGQQRKGLRETEKGVKDKGNRG